VALVAVMVNPDRGETVKIAEEMRQWLEGRRHGVRVVTLTTSGAMEADGPGGLDDMSLDGVDLAVSLGGDGTFLALASLAAGTGVPLLGVNFGRLGYLLQTAPGDAIGAVEAFLGDRAVVEDRALLQVVVGPFPSSPGGGREGLEGVGDRSAGSPDAPNVAVARGGKWRAADATWWWPALNEAVVEKTVPGHTVQLGVLVDGERMVTHRADGVIVATPTGSTAYNLSAGGPLLSPALRGLVVTPVAPHLSPATSVVLDQGHSVSVVVDQARPAVLVIDGRPVGRLPCGSVVQCRLADEPIRVVSFGRPLAGALGAVLSPAPTGG
jgi:NAD+ kinase